MEPTPTVPTSQVESQGKNSLAVFILILLAALVIALALIYYIGSSGAKTGGAYEITDRSDEPAGKLVRGFSGELIIVNDAVILESGTLKSMVEGVEGTSIFAAYSTKAGQNYLHNSYLDFAQAKSYRILIGRVNEDKTSTIVFKRPSDSVAVTIIGGADNSRVEVLVTKN